MKRNEYGQLINVLHTLDTASRYETDLWLEAECMILAAQRKGLIPLSFDDISFDRKRRADGNALHHEVYDISPDARHILLCIRATEGSKYGVRTTSKKYVIISAHGLTVRVIEANKAKAARAAKQAGDNLGEAIAICLGKAKLTVASSKSIAQNCYKIAALDDAGHPVSVYDKTPWTIGKTRSERSTENHNGGFYVFPTVEAAMAAWGDRIVFADDWMTADRYTLLECECQGRAYMHDNSKMCISTVKPVREIAQFITK